MMELVLQQRQTLNLVMTAELRQAIKLLQYSTYELYQFIQEQQLENPLIELEEKVQDYPYRQSSSRINYSEDVPPNPIDFVASNDQNMFDNLLEQVQWLSISEQQKELLQYLVLNLDENAYLPLSISDIAQHLAISEEKVEEGIRLLQQLEPVGVGARSLSECLLLQVNYYYPEETLAAQIIENHLEELAHKKWKDLTKFYRVTLADIQHVYEIIRSLDPKPSAALSTDSAEYVHPDIIVKEENNKFIVQLNDGYIPNIRFNSHYLSLTNVNKNMSSYINDHFKNFQWLMNSIEQRRTTILKITQVVINHQQDFFKKGFAGLKPLTLSEVAEEIDMHESTVSRATMNKVIQTPKGTFDMRRLFASRLDMSDGSAMSQTRVKLLLQDVINKEDKARPLSDQKIADLLKKDKGVTISRRTVAKYRDELNIPSSRQRREIVV